MKLFEYEAKKLFKKYGIDVPSGKVVHECSFVGLRNKRYAVKAQVLVGGRGKAGGVKIGKGKELPRLCTLIMGKKIKGEKVKTVLEESALDIAKEYYLGFTFDRANRSYALLFSEMGGVDIEEVAEKYPGKVVKLHFVDFDKRDISKKIKEKKIIEIAAKLFRLFSDYDAVLAEINPLVLTKKGKFVAADAKLVLDDNAVYRHKEFSEHRELTKLEQEAAKGGINYVELDGKIAIIGNGAGLVMATLDTVQHFGGKPANFLDVGGGTGADMMQKALKIALSKKGIRGLFINIFAGITRCDEIAEGLVAFKKKNKIKIPVVVRMIGTNETKGRKILRDNGIHAIDNMEKGAKKIVNLVK